MYMVTVYSVYLSVSAQSDRGQCGEWGLRPDGGKSIIVIVCYCGQCLGYWNRCSAWLDDGACEISDSYCYVLGRFCQLICREDIVLNFVLCGVCWVTENMEAVYYSGAMYSLYECTVRVGTSALLFHKQRFLIQTGSSKLA